MSLVSKAQKIRDALVTVEGLKCYHLKKPATVKAPYAVWQEPARLSEVDIRIPEADITNEPPPLLTRACVMKQKSLST